MKRNTITIVGLAILLLVVWGVQVTAQDVSKLKFPKLNKIEIPNVERITLDNGMRLYILEDHSFPVFNVSVRVNCGSYLEPEEKVGLAEMCGTVMRTGGTSKWTGDEIDQRLEDIGGAVETSIGLTSGRAAVNVLSDYTDLGLDILADVLRNPVFNEDKIDLARVQARSDISRRNDDIGTIARREYNKLIYGSNSPYASQTEYKTINAISRDDLVAFHDKYFHPENVQMAIWGDFNKKDLLVKINQYFGDWKKGTETVPPLPEVNYNWRSKVYYVEKPDAKQSYIRMGHIGGLATDPDNADLIVMNSILGGGFGSRLTDAVRTKLGLAYSVGGRYISNFGYPGYFFAVASTKPGSTIQATEEMIKQIKSMSTDIPTQEEMEKGKDGYLNSFVFNFDNRGEVLARMMNYDYFGLPADFLEKEKENVEKVTPEAVQEAARMHIRPDSMIILVVGNAADFDQPLSTLGLGEPESIDITIPSGEEEKEIVITDETLKKGRELIKEAAAAQGGVDNFQKVNAVMSRGTYTLITPQGSFPITFEELNAFPDQARSVFSMMGRQIFDISNGPAGWKTNPQTGELVAKTEEDLSKEQQDRERNTVAIFKQANDPNLRVVFDGSGDVDGKPVDFVVLLDKDDQSLCRMGISTETHQLISKAYWGQTAMGEGTVEDIYGDFKEVKGVTLPMSSQQLLNGQKVGTIAYTDFQINPEIPANAFEKPE